MLKTSDLHDLEVNQQTLAQLIGVTRQAIGTWVRHEGMPCSKPDPRAAYFDLEVTIPWLREHKWQTDTTKDRRARATTELLEMKRDKEAGLLVLASDVQAEWEALLTRLRVSLLGFPDRLVPLLAECADDRERLVVARREMRATLRSLVDDETARAQTLEEAVQSTVQGTTPDPDPETKPAPTTKRRKR